VLKKLVSQQYQLEMLILEEWMPQNHLVRDADDANDYEFILNEISSLCYQPGYLILSSCPK
jgi:hypothetical protein